MTWLRPLTCSFNAFSLAGDRLFCGIAVAVRKA